MLAFRRIYGSRGEGETAGREEGSPDDSLPQDPATSLPDPAGSLPSPWAAPLWAGPGSPAQADASRATGPAETQLSELASELVQRLLVEEGPAAGEAGGQEVRLLLKHCALEGTEVRLRRGEDGLHLLFLPDSPAGADLLRRRGDSLEGLLKSKLDIEAVKVSVRDGDAPERGGTGRRA
jgi:hypothetical protein